jgi:hypothetical protein
MRCISKPSAVVISIVFVLPVWKAKRVAVASDMYRSRIYLYPAGVCRTEATGGHVDIVESPTESG